MAKQTNTVTMDQSKSNIKRPQFRRQYYGCHIPHKETKTTPSQTVPRQAVSVSEILNANSRGVQITGALTPVWNGSRFLPDWQKMDLIDRHMYVEETKRQVAEYEKRVEQARERAKEAQEKEFNERMEKKLALVEKEKVQANATA